MRSIPSVEILKKANFTRSHRRCTASGGRGNGTVPKQNDNDSPGRLPFPPD